MDATLPGWTNLDLHHDQQALCSMQRLFLWPVCDDDDLKSQKKKKEREIIIKCSERISMRADVRFGAGFRGEENREPGRGQ